MAGVARQWVRRSRNCCRLLEGTYRALAELSCDGVRSAVLSRLEGAAGADSVRRLCGEAGEKRVRTNTGDGSCFVFGAPDCNQRGIASDRSDPRRDDRVVLGPANTVPSQVLVPVVGSGS
jgi:hypothetical protein